MSAWHTDTVLAIVGMTMVTVLTRCLFFFSERPWQLPSWVQRGLQYAPIAALAAVVAPEIIMSQGQLIQTWRDARIYAAMAGAGWFFYRKGQGQAVLGTIVAGMLVYLPLHLIQGW